MENKIMDSRNKDIDHIINKIVEGFNPDKIILFGSHAYGNPNYDSDLDLLIIMESELNKRDRAAQIRMKLSPYPIPLDLLVYTPEELEYWQDTINHILYEIVRKGKVVYERKTV